MLLLYYDCRHEVLTCLTCQLSQNIVNNFLQKQSLCSDSLSLINVWHWAKLMHFFAFKNNLGDKQK